MRSSARTRSAASRIAQPESGRCECRQRSDPAGASSVLQRQLAAHRERDEVKPIACRSRQMNKAKHAGARGFGFDRDVIGGKPRRQLGPDRAPAPLIAYRSGQKGQDFRHSRSCFPRLITGEPQYKQRAPKSGLAFEGQSPVHGSGAIAQLGERLHGMQEVVGSIPSGSTISSLI